MKPWYNITSVMLELPEGHGAQGPMYRLVVWNDWDNPDEILGAVEHTDREELLKWVKENHPDAKYVGH
jgi:hypothetical protein